MAGPLEKLQVNVVKTVFAQGEEPRSFNAVAGQMLDESQELNRRAVKGRWTSGDRMRDASARVGAAIEPTTSDADRLRRIGKGFAIPRRGSMTDERYQDVLDAAWEKWAQGGTAQAIVDALTAQNFPDVQVFEEWQGTLGLAASGYGWRFVVILGPNYGDRGWSGMTGPFELGSTLLGVKGATAGEVADVVRDILQWKSSFAFPLALVLRFGDAPLLGINTVLPFILGGSIGSGVARRPIGERSLLGAWPIGFPLGTNYEIRPL
jgi:hypothetical protein